MKKIAATILAVLFGTSLTFAHQMEGGSVKGLFGLKAEYLHVLLNPLPVYGLSVGVLVLAAGLLARSKAARNIGLGLIILCGASAWPVLYFGQHGYNHLYPQLDTESQQWLDAHMERAERFIYAFYLTALLGIAALAIQKTFLRATRVLTLLTLAAAMASLGIGAWISRAGGEVSHSEFRGEESPPSAPAHEHGGASSHEHGSSSAHEHDMTNQSHDDMRMPETNGSHQPSPASGHSHEETSTPNTPEGIWKQIHEHCSELDTTIKEKNLGAVHSHAAAIHNLTAALVDVAHPDHKAVVQGGVEKANRAVSELQKSADTGNQAAAETNFKSFDAALRLLEEQMNKQ